MQSVKQQQILGYFIEEAKEHLDTIEQGLVNLKVTMSNSEQINELFRAAHSIKGGAAMLGFDSIHKTAHHFEDCFKHLQEHPVKIDQKLENLFLKGFDTLRELIEALQSPFGLREEEAQQAVIASEPIFTELEMYLRSLLNREATPASPSNKTGSATNATAHINTILKAMLQLFKQGDSIKSRQQMVALCNRLIQVSGTAKPWVTALQTVQRAIANPKNTYSTLAPIVIRDLKQASDLLLTRRVAEIEVSQNLLKLVMPVQAATLPAQVAQLSVRQVSRHEQISIPREPRAAARVLLETFNKNELIEIAQFLMKAIQ
ncbi:histidine kinase [Phormidesmis priestleyi ULC007]|uniref:Histidine kinase n=1 Tax=Phormidesmis priestleyi ULC007 TaxID=1920490 RepID=A0A2T1DLA0_9CYAN|nr:Hpt domain-containing protein [Phormidesmis priestleyi]PSB21252.1 histidine kinase [Phormidesmis priestleyi ULC007]PZO51220.1 MAG: histidine kinase [Phormidesmis priestleyi]